MSYCFIFSENFQKNLKFVFFQQGNVNVKCKCKTEVLHDNSIDLIKQYRSYDNCFQNFAFYSLTEILYV